MEKKSKLEFPILFLIYTEVRLNFVEINNLPHLHVILIADAARIRAHIYTSPVQKRDRRSTGRNEARSTVVPFE